MRDHLSYLKYVLRHKLYVWEARRLMGLSFWRALTHDISKFTLSEWNPYVRTFYNPDGSCKKVEAESEAFDLAWNRHQKRNLHHWQWWTLLQDDGVVKAIEMPTEYVQEMVADWIGAGMAITGRYGVDDWYEKNKTKMVLHPKTQAQVAYFLVRARALFEAHGRNL